MDTIERGTYTDHKFCRHACMQKAWNEVKSVRSLHAGCVCTHRLSIYPQAVWCGKHMGICRPGEQWHSSTIDNMQYFIKIWRLWWVLYQNPYHSLWLREHRSEMCRRSRNCGVAVEQGEGFPLRSQECEISLCLHDHTSWRTDHEDMIEDNECEQLAMSEKCVSLSSASHMIYRYTYTVYISICMRVIVLIR